MSANFTVEILNVNEKPSLLTFKNIGGQIQFSDNFPSVNEMSAVGSGTAVGTVVGTMEAIDADSGDKLTFSLDNDGGGRFSLSQSTSKCQTARNKVHQSDE